MRIKQLKLDEVARVVEAKLKEVSDRTLRKLQEMSPDIASTLDSSIPSVGELKWADVFKKVPITGDEDFSLNKCGSGVKRLILLYFFWAKVERRQKVSSSASVIYTVEDPETSQHSDNQMKLVKALSALAEALNTQVIMTTHSAKIVKSLQQSDIRIVQNESAAHSHTL